MLALLCAGGSVNAADEAVLEEIRAGYIQTITSMPRLWTRCRESKTYNSERMAERSNSDGALIDWAIDGDKFHVSYVDGEGRPRVWFAFDGQTTWQLKFSKEDGEIERVFKQRLETKTDADLTGRVTPGRFLGLYFNIGPILGSGVGLKSLLAAEPLTLEGREDVEGASCWKVSLSYRTPDPEYQIPMTLWFDPDEDYLPRQTEWESIGGSRPVTRIVGFRKISVDGRLLSFPSEMVNFHSLATTRLTLVDVKVNDDLPPNLFKPVVPRGILTFDLDNEADEQRLLAIHRAPAVAEMRAKAEATIQKRKQVRPAPPLSEDRASGRLDAAISKLRLGPLVLIVTGIIVLLLITMHVLRRG